MVIKGDCPGDVGWLKVTLFLKFDLWENNEF